MLFGKSTLTVVGVAIAMTLAGGDVLLADDPLVTEFMASNDTVLADEDGDYSDWIEIHNPGTSSVDLAGWYLTDDDADLTKWQFPSEILGTNGYLVVFASDKNRAVAGFELHTNFKLTSSGEYLALVGSDGTSVVHEYTPWYPQQHTDISYGMSGDEYGYLAEPTPGQANTGFLVEAPLFSPESNFFAEGFSLELTVASPSAVIRYTTDGTEPTMENGHTYDTPIAIATTTIIIAAAYESGTERSRSVTQYYVKLSADVLDFNSNLPLVLVDTFGAEINQSVRTLSMAGVIDTTDGRAWVVDAPDFAGPSGFKIRGSSSTNFPKKQYSFEAWDENNEDLEVTFLDFPPEADWILYAPYSDKSLMRNVLSYQWSNDIDRYAVRTRFVEMFLNIGGGELSWSDYVGVYVLMEKIKRDPNRVDIIKLGPGDNAEPEITGGYIIKKDRLDPGDSGFYTSIGQRLCYVEPKEVEITSEQAAYLKGYIDEFESVLYGPDFTDPVNGYAKYIDVDSFIDHHILVEVTKNIDGFRLSTFWFKDRGGKLIMGPIWDYNLSLGNANYLEGWLPAGWYNELLSNSSYPWWRRLFEDEEFQLRYADRWYELREEEFVAGSLLAGIDGYAALVDEAQVRNFDRWPVLGTYVWPNWFIAETYEEEIAWMKQWLIDRLDWIDQQFGAPPVFNQDGGVVPSGFGLTMSAPSGVIYYTLNGSDPRLIGGAINPDALIYSGTPLTLTTNVVVKSRVLDESEWSALNEASFMVASLPVIINEIMYNPDGDDAQEFLELYNPSLTLAVDLSGWRLNGIAFTFPSETVLPADDYLVVVLDEVVFEATYGSGIYVAGEYGGRLDNGGENLELLDVNGEVIDSVRYDDDAPWPTSPDGAGPSLELIDPTQNNDRPVNWSASLTYGGTPGAPNGTAGTTDPVPDLWVNEVLPVNGSINTDEQGEYDPWIEIYNGSDTPIDLGGLYLTDSYSVPTKWQIPVGTTLDGTSWMIFWADNEPGDGPLHTNFALGDTGGSVGLYTADETIIDYLNYDALPADLSYGKFPDGSSVRREFTTVTPEAANQSDTVPVILNEYNAVKNSNYLKDSGSDTFFGRVLGNGGNWFELVVTEDHVNLCGWKLVWTEEPSDTGTLTLTSNVLWSDLRAGTIITFTELDTSAGGLDTDTSYDPAGDDWWISINTLSGVVPQETYVTTTTNVSGDGPGNFSVGNDSWQLTIKDSLEQVVFGPAGEGIEPASGVGSDEVFKLEMDPGPYVHPRSDYNDGTSSTFGSPNVWAGSTMEQDFSELRDVLGQSAPDPPILIEPTDGAIAGVSPNPVLSVIVTDPDLDTLDVTFYGRQAAEDFTIVILPDTQFYSCGAPCGSDPAIFASQTQWLVNNRDELNIVYVGHLGDLVETANDVSEWDNADAAMTLLEDPMTTGLADGIPYGVAVGNHDQWPLNDPGTLEDEGATTTLFNQYFGLTRFQERAYYGGHYGINNDNHYDLFSASGMDFIAIYLEYNPTDNPLRQAGIDWAESVLQTYSDRRALIVSHYILDPDATFTDQGQALYDAFKDNPNVFLMTGGHLWYAARRTDTFESRTIHTVLSNYQAAPNGGDGWLRINTFLPDDDAISVQTYSPWLDEYNTESDHQFTLDYSMESNAPLVEIGTVSAVASGGTAGMNWPGRQIGTTYEWCVTVFDGKASATGARWTFAGDGSCGISDDCDDANACTDDTCVSDFCEYTNNAEPCDDGLFCTETDTCSNGVCVGSGDPCPGEICNESLDACFECLVAEHCDDGNPCTDDACIVYVCEHDLIPGCVVCVTSEDCDLGNPCLVGTCGLDGTCSFTPGNDGQPCDDDWACTTDDICSNGVCVGIEDCPPGQGCYEETGTCEGLNVVTLQDGLDGYDGTQDTFLQEASPDAANGGLDNWEWDGEDGGGENIGLLRFDSIFGIDPGQVPPGSIITSATLTLVAFNSTTPPAGDIYEALDDWEQSTAAWNNYGGEPGVQPDELGNFVAAAPAVLDTNEVDVTASLQAWNHAPASNLGWIFVPNSTDGLQVRSSEYATTLYRPRLVIRYSELCDDNSDCDDNLFCNGAEYCDGDSQCQPGSDPCPGQMCDESNDQCVDCLEDGDCDDGLFCNGSETCVDNVCVDGIAPCDDPCEQCDESTDTCDWCIFDLDGDGFIGPGDFSFFAGCYGGNYGCDPPDYRSGVEPCCIANFDESGDSFVGPGDFAGFAGCFGLNCDECAICWGSRSSKGRGAAARTSGLVSVKLVAVRAPTPVGVADALPRSGKSFLVGQTFYIELWASNTGSEDGLAAVYVDMEFAPTRLKVLELVPGERLGLFAHGALESEPGLVYSWGGCASLGGDALGVGSWVRVATLEARALRVGKTLVKTSPSVGGYGIAVLNRLGTLDKSLITFDEITLRMHGRKRVIRRQEGVSMQNQRTKRGWP